MTPNNILVSIALFTTLFVAPLTTVTRVQADAVVPASLIAIGDKSELLKSGRFQSIEKRTGGDVRLVRGNNGRLYIDFDNNFRTESGSDLFVVLSVSNDLKNAPVEGEIFFMVSPLIRVQGGQRYILPGDFNPDTYQSIALWNRQTNTLFGAATWK